MTKDDLKIYLKKNNLTQRELAEKMCVHIMTVTKWATGQRPISAMAEKLMFLLEKKNG